MEEIVGEYGMVCISRSGSNPEQFIYDSDVLTKHQVRRSCKLGKQAISSRHLRSKFVRAVHNALYYISECRKATYTSSLYINEVI